MGCFSKINPIILLIFIYGLLCSILKVYVILIISIRPILITYKHGMFVCDPPKLCLLTLVKVGEFRPWALGNRRLVYRTPPGSCFVDA